MNKIITGLLVVISITISTSFTSISTSDDIVGEVIWEKSGCDFYIVETQKYFVLVEWYKGRLYEGDKLKGELHSYGYKYLKNTSRNDDEVKVYIENYWTFKTICFEWLKEHDKCGLGNN